tara:strand:- start:10122 stop:11564 length:1443 start_codon:yes stop_codon:yes gene_type:complete
MAKVFLSYRRADPLPNWQVKRIGKMCEECGFEEVFVDRDTWTIPPGSNYRDEIDKAVRASDVVLVLIGDRWQALLDQKGDDPNDMVQLEIRLGLELKKTVVPLLLGGTMPGLDDLPERLQQFHYCNGQSFEPDTMDSLLPLLLKGLVGKSEAEPTSVVTPPLPQPEPVAANPLQNYAAKAQQRAEEEVLRQQRLAERQQSWGEQFEQFQELRQNPHLSFEEIREALQSLCRHWEVAFPQDWDGETDLLTEWEGDCPVVRAAMKLPFEQIFDLGNGVQMPFCYIPAGSFEREGFTVTLTKDFWMAKYPVNQGEWTAIMGSNPSHFKDGGDRAPVEQVSWNEAQEFCAKFEGLRLPTEAEWEYACRAGTTGDYNVEGASLDELGWYFENSGKTTHPVGEKKPNAWGLYDMHGNVWEWCEDWYGECPKQDVSVPTGPKEQAKFRGFRGGCWAFDASNCRSASRDWNVPGIWGSHLGFRPFRSR